MALSYDPEAERELADSCAERRAVDLGGRRVRADALRDALLAGTGVAQVSGARVVGALSLDGAEVRALLRLDRCTFDERITLEGASTLAVSITGSTLAAGLDAATARIAGRLDLRGSVIDGRGRNAVKLVHTHIEGGLRLDGARLLAPGRMALDAGGLVMTGGVYCERGFAARGRVSFPGAQLPGGLYMRGAHIAVEEPAAIAFDADGAVASTIRLSGGFRADGKIRLRGTQVDDLLHLGGAELGGGLERPDADSVLMCVGARAEALDMRFARAPRGKVNLRNAHFARIQDDHRTWPPILQLDGLTYDWLEEATLEPGPSPSAGRQNVATRLRWLSLTPGYFPQSYEQLAAHYRRLGHDVEARRVLLARQRHRRTTLGPAGRIWGHLLDATVGYGYRPWLAGLWLALLAVIGWTVFATHTPVPNKAGEGPRFNAFVYALDLLVPVGGLGQGGAWHWDQPGVQALAYALVGVGWILTTAVVAGVTRTLSRV
ncbi:MULTISPECIES: oxidoreductase [unclassified Streptomyces]|uniref:oxidoreductase n=1 Tax=unclassified Streptomyces TaxID=2593676 RepID=UPI00278BE704|nr:MULTISPECIES: oxidoreductase [unclassified Streptomyces]